MKKILVLMSVAALAVGCNKTEVIGEQDDQGTKLVSFETYLGKSTKGVSKDAFKMGDQFQVIGVKSTDPFNLEGPLFTEYVFNNTEKSVPISHFGVDGTNKVIWSYENPVEWDAQKATFFAFSPVPQLAKTFGITNLTIADNAIPTIDFEVIGGYTNVADISTSRVLIKNQTDLLCAYSPDNVKAGGAINLEFGHALSQIRFSVLGLHTKGLLRLNSITMKKVMTKATLALAKGGAPLPGSVDYLAGWGVATTPMDFAVNLKAEVASALPPVTGGDPIALSVTDEDESLLFIPQPLKGLELEVKYSYSVDGKEWVDYETGTTMNQDLAKLSPYWNPNKRYNYVITISPGKAVQFGGSIGEWEPKNGTADLEYRTMNLSADGSTIATAPDKTPEKFTMKKDDQVSVSYLPDNVINWVSAKNAADVDQVLTAPVTIAADEDWTFYADWNDAAAARTATILVNRAPYDKVLADGSTVKVASGVSKFVVTQNAGTALNPSSLVYGKQNAPDVVTGGFAGFTTVSYPNALGTTVIANPLTEEKPFRRFRVALNNVQDGATPAKDAKLTPSQAAAACAKYFENVDGVVPAVSAGKWRLPRASELKLMSDNSTTLLAAGTKIKGDLKGATLHLWSATMAGADSYMALSNGALVSNIASTVEGNVRCVYEEK